MLQLWTPSPLPLTTENSSSPASTSTALYALSPWTVVNSILSSYVTNQASTGAESSQYYQVDNYQSNVALLYYHVSKEEWLLLSQPQWLLPLGSTRSNKYNYYPAWPTVLRCHAVSIADSSNSCLLCNCLHPDYTPS